MNIRGKLSLTFILLLIFGVTAVSSYSILFIRAFLLDESVKQMEEDGRWMAQTMQNLPDGLDFEEKLGEVKEIVRYNLALYDSTGTLMPSSYDGTFKMRDKVLPEPIRMELNQAYSNSIVINEKGVASIYVYANLPQSSNHARYLQISQSKDKIFEPITTIRWIIYSGMFISIVLIIIVSTIFSRYLSQPIISLSNAAKRIAKGDVNHRINLKRQDEFGELSVSLNQMASRLREDNEKLQAINEKQRQFFADIAHEVRNPLHTIMGSLEMLEMDKLQPEKRNKYIGNAISQAERLSNLFQDLMTLQRYDSDEDFIQRTKFNLSDITGKIDNWFREDAEKKGITLHIDKHPVTVLADPVKIEQVLENLISNALKFTKKGEVSLNYEVTDKRVQISVSDTGPGIPAHHLEKIFDRFYRIDEARSREQGGTGLGLAIVKSILVAHNKEIQVTSTEGKGSTFSFELDKVA
ncbi:MAG: HAMP domain-containing sensor histidine kinase [Balneolales bacterium]